MTVIRKWSGNGLAAGALTTTSAGTGDNAFSGVSPSGVAVVATGVRQPQIELTQRASSTCHVWWDIPAQSYGAYRAYYTTPSVWPASSFRILQIQTVSGTTATDVLYVTIAPSTGQVRVVAPGGAVIAATSSAAPLALSTRYRIELQLSQGGVGVNGTAPLQVYAGDSSTAYTTAPATNHDYGASHSRVLFGNPTNTPTVDVWQMDDLAVGDNSTPIGSPVTAPASSLVAAAGPDQVDREPFSTVSLAASATGGSPAYTYAWTQTSGPAVSLSGSGATRTFTAPAASSASTLGFQVTVTDSASATSTDGVVVTVAPHVEWLKVGSTLTAIRKG